MFENEIIDGMKKYNSAERISFLQYVYREKGNILSNPNISYYDDLNKTELEIENSDGYYKYYLRRNGSILEVSKSIDIAENIHTIFFKETNTSPTIINYQNAQILNSDQFIASILSEKVSIYVDKENTAIIDENNRIIAIYPKDNINKDSILEKYWFCDDGKFFCKNFANKTMDFRNTNNSMHYIYTQFLKPKNKFKCHILDQCPTELFISDEKKDTTIAYHMKYNKNGIVTNCFKDENKIMLSEIVEFISKGITISIHPHLFDPFDYTKIIEPERYWAIDLYQNKLDYIVISRFIYDLHDESSILIEDINKAGYMKC